MKDKRLFQIRSTLSSRDNWLTVDKLFRMGNELLKELDRLKALLKVDWQPIGEVELVHGNWYYVRHISNLGMYLAEFYNMGEPKFITVESQGMNHFMFESSAASHVAEFKYPEPPEGL